MEAATVVSWFGAYVVLVFCCICFANGVYFLAELIEEHTALTKRVLSTTIRLELVLHVLLLVVDRGPWLPLLVGAAAHASYLQLLPCFPFIPLPSPAGFLSFGLLLSSQGLWLRHFWPSPYSAARILGFCLVVVWLVPLTVLLSLSANESVLPGGPGSVPVGSGSAGSQRKRRSDKNMLLRLVDLTHLRRD